MCDEGSSRRASETTIMTVSLPLVEPPEVAVNFLQVGESGRLLMQPFLARPLFPGSDLTGPSGLYGTGSRLPPIPTGTTRRSTPRERRSWGRSRVCGGPPCTPQRRPEPGLTM